MARVGISLFVGVLAFGGSVRAEVPVRVRVATAQEQIHLAGAALRVEGEPMPGDRVVVVAGRDGNIRAGPVRQRGSVHGTAEGLLEIEGRRLPGSVTVVRTPEGRLDAVNVVPLERYVERAVSGEIYARWPAEALKAQAVAARTYALYAVNRHREDPFDVEATTLSQRYVDGPVPGAVREAVGATRGRYLAFQGAPILAAFHTTAGGRTAASEEVWGEPLPYLRGVDSPDEESPEYFWSYEVEYGELRRALEIAGLRAGSDPRVEVLERSPSGRVARLSVSGAQLTGRTLRQIVGRRAIRSTLFDVRTEGGLVRFLGSGSGHGVGLSQWGALQMAREGRTYIEILRHYFPGTQERLLDGSAAAPGARP